jgi:hypothetical protein
VAADFRREMPTGRRALLSGPLERFPPEGGSEMLVNPGAPARSAAPLECQIVSLGYAKTAHLVPESVPMNPKALGCPRQVPLVPPQRRQDVLLLELSSALA